MSGPSKMSDSAKPKPSGMYGRAVLREFRETVGTWWCKEMTNFNMKTVGVSFFCYLACVAPAITFGAVYSKLVGNWMGATETLAGTAWLGIAYALLGGMPVMINGGTGPVLAFTAVLYQVSEDIGVPFLTFRAWIGLWICLYMIVAAFLDLNRFIYYATRFTDEIFSTLICVIFIVNALYSPSSPVGVFHYFDSTHESHEVHADYEDYSHTAAGLLSVLCCFGTTWLAIKLKSIKASAFFGPRTRGIIADFAVVGAACTFILIDRYVFQDVRSETLVAPDELGPTFVCCEADCRRFFPDDCPELSSGMEFGNRPWVVDFFDLRGQDWVPVFAALPALLGFILLFLDNGITWHLINSPDNKLKHGHAYNYDTVLVGVGVFVNSCFGLPWLCAATVRSVNHLLALAEVDDKSKKIVAVQETRLTHLLIHCLILGTLFSMKILKMIPMSVLYGIFLYMGVTAMSGNQFWERIKMLIMQSSSAKYPNGPYTEPYLARKKMNLMTVIQLGCFVLLYGVKSVKQIAIAFPIVIALCIPIRTLLLPKFFSGDELTLLDGEDEDIKRVMAKIDGDVEGTSPPEAVKGHALGGEKAEPPADSSTTADA